MVRLDISEELRHALFEWAYDDIYRFALSWEGSSVGGYVSAKEHPGELMKRIALTKEIIEQRGNEDWKLLFQELLSHGYFYQIGRRDAEQQWKLHKGQFNGNEMFVFCVQTARLLYEGEAQCFWYIQGFYEAYREKEMKEIG